MYFKGYLPSLSNFPYSGVTKAFTLIVCHNCWKFKSRKMFYLLLRKKKFFFALLSKLNNHPAVISLIRLEQYFIFWTLHTHQMFFSQILSHYHGHHFINKEAKACQLKVTGQEPGLELGPLKVSALGYFCKT